MSVYLKIGLLIVLLLLAALFYPCFQPPGVVRVTPPVDGVRIPDDTSVGYQESREGQVFDSTSPSGKDAKLRVQDRPERSVREKIDDLENLRSEVEIQLKRLNETPEPEQIRVAAGLDLPSNPVLAAYREFRLAHEEANSKQAQGLASNHPDVVALNKRADAALLHAEQAVTMVQQELRDLAKGYAADIERLEEDQ